MSLTLPPLDVAAATPTPAPTIADGGDFAESLVAAVEGAGHLVVGDEAETEAETVGTDDEASSDDAALAGLVTVTAAPISDGNPVPGDRLLAQRGSIGRGRAVAAAAIALARIGDLEAEAIDGDDLGVGTAGAPTDEGITLDATTTLVDPSGATAAPAAQDGAIDEPTSRPAPSSAPVADEPPPVDVASAVPDAAPTASEDAAVNVQSTAPAPMTAEASADRGSELTRSVAARVEAAVEALRNAPPPREATIEVEGMRLLLRLRGDIVQVTADGPLPDSWQRDLGAALEERGLQLGQPHSGGTSSDARAHGGEESPATSDPAASTDTTTTTSAHRPAGRDDSVLL